jgi:hypothetical protein
VPEVPGVPEPAEPELLAKAKASMKAARPNFKVLGGVEAGGEQRANPEPAEGMPKPQPGTALVVVPPPLPPLSKWDEVVEGVNRQHALIESVGGKTVIASFEPWEVDPTQTRVVFQNKDSFLLRYSNRFVTIDVPDGRGGVIQGTRPLGQWWLSHPKRRQHRGVTNRPGGAKIEGECLNLWTGWGVEPKPGDWGLIRKHVEEVVADGSQVKADYVKRWIAWGIQNPGNPAGAALVLIGDKGSGKGTLARPLERIFGVHAFQATSQEHVIGKHNEHLQACVFFVADEAYWGGDKRCIGRLQGMITEPTLTIEPKNINAFQVRNCLHLVMLAEPGWVIPAGRHERRYAAMDISKSRLGNREYFNALHRQVYNGGAEAMFYDLSRLDLGDWHPRDIPEELLHGEALQRQQSLSLPPMEQWWLMLLHDGTLPGSYKRYPNRAFSAVLLKHAVDTNPKLRWRLDEYTLRDFLIGMGCEKRHFTDGNGYIFPPLDEAREAWVQRYGPTTWDAKVEDWQERLGLLDRIGGGG